MMYLTILVMFVLFLGVVMVASNPSPYFGALGLVVVAGMGCVMLSEVGESFLSLVLFLIYLGGMLVVFVYTTALAADPFPEAFNVWETFGCMLLYLVFMLFSFGIFWWGGFDGVWVVDNGREIGGMLENLGMGEMYGLGGKVLMIGGWVLFLTLFVVLEMTRGLCRGALRGV